MKRFMYFSVLVLALSILSTTFQASAQNPCNPCSKKAANMAKGKAASPAKPALSDAPAVNPCHAKMGTVFLIHDPMGRDSVTFTSNAPLEDIVGTSNQVRGYVVFDPEKPDKGARGLLRVPVASLSTGIPLRDEHLKGKEWLNAVEHPDIVFAFTEVQDLREIRAQEGKSFQATLVGELSLNGRTRQVQVLGARFAYLPESEKTKTKAPGNLLAGRASFKVSLKDFDVAGFKGVVGSKVSDQISVNISFVASSQAAAAANPCNPCNPCAKKAKKS